MSVEIRGKLIGDMTNSLTTGIDVLSDYAEIGLDSVLDISSEIATALPIVKTVFGIARVGFDLYSRNLLKNLIKFLKEFNDGSIDSQKLNAYKKKLEDSATAEKEVGRVLLLLNKTIDTDKAVYYSRLYKAYINDAIEWQTFVEYGDNIDNLSVVNLEVLKRIIMKRHNLGRLGDNHSLAIFAGLGLLDNYIPKLTDVGNLHFDPRTRMFKQDSLKIKNQELNRFAKTLCAIIFPIQREETNHD